MTPRQKLEAAAYLYVKEPSAFHFSLLRIALWEYEHA